MTGEALSQQVLERGTRDASEPSCRVSLGYLPPTGQRDQISSKILVWGHAIPLPLLDLYGDWNPYVVLDKGPDSGARLSGFRCCTWILTSWMMFIKLLHLSALVSSSKMKMMVSTL